MRAYIKLWGHEHLIQAVSWYNNKITCISLEDENREYRTIFDFSTISEEKQLDRSNKEERLRTDLNKEIYWKDSNKKMPLAEDI
ncbi:hypothetical protein [Oceanobacillus kapialis]|uniref:Uncharacterized protein n=1 Tax=Oceanobacillus kapialis TaxID=481353 RepID=A0ABW5PZM4_9BACI